MHSASWALSLPDPAELRTDLARFGRPSAGHPVTRVIVALLGS